MGTEAGEGITFSVPPFASTGFCTIPEGGSCRRGVGAATAAAEGERSLQPLLVPPPPPPPGSFWNVEGAAATGTSCPTTAPGSSATRGRGNSSSGGGRRTTVAYVINEASQGQLVVAESEALQSLREACETVGATLETLHFGKLDFGETTVLDRFYNAVLGVQKRFMLNSQLHTEFPSSFQSLARPPPIHFTYEFWWLQFSVLLPLGTVE